MTLEQALRLFAEQLKLDADTLIAYAAEDNIGGYDGGVGSWYVGSLWSVEGKVLYALVRAMKPALVVEIGVGNGCSATHILTALDRNATGKLISVDMDANAGADVPKSLKSRWEFVHSDGAVYLNAEAPQANIVYEDALHDPIGTNAILTAIRDHISPDLVISHDAEHFIVGKDVREAWSDVFGSFTSHLVEPSDCGFAWKVLS